MSDTDWSGLLGTVVIGGMAIKMTQSMFGNPCSNNCNHSDSNKKKKKSNLTSSKTFFNSPW